MVEFCFIDFPVVVSVLSQTYIDFLRRTDWYRRITTDYLNMYP